MKRNVSPSVVPWFHKVRKGFQAFQGVGGQFGAYSRGFWAQFRALRAHFGPNEEVWGPFWAQFRGSVAHFEPNEGVGARFGPIQRFRGPFWA